jgi:hypothetical protein
VITCRQKAVHFNEMIMDAMVPGRSVLERCVPEHNVPYDDVPWAKRPFDETPLLRYRCNMIKSRKRDKFIRLSCHYHCHDMSLL